MADAILHPGELPVGSAGRRSSGWWGLLMLVLTEGALFGYLLFSYYYLLVQHDRSWLEESHPSLRYPLPDTLILLLSSVTAWWAERGAKRGARLQLLAGLGATLLLGILFVGIQVLEWKSKKFSLASSAFSSLFFTTTGFHMAHVVAGLLGLAAVLLWSAQGLFGPKRHAPVTIATYYWHFVDAVWLSVFFTFYLAPYLW